MHSSHMVLSTKHSHSRWCPSPSQVLPPFHRKMGGWPGRCPSRRFPGHCDPRSRPHLAAGAAVISRSASVPSLLSCTAELPRSSWGHGRKEPARGCPLCLPYAWDIPATWQEECGGASRPRRNSPQGVGSPGPRKPKESSLFHVVSLSTGKGKASRRLPGSP